MGIAETPAVIFVIAYDAHAIRAFEVEALDYVLKPFENLLVTPLNLTIPSWLLENGCHDEIRKICGT